MELHGAGLDRLMEIVAQAGASGYALMDDFAGDDLVASLLLLYGLHPHDLETRVSEGAGQDAPVSAFTRRRRRAAGRGRRSGQIAAGGKLS